MSDQPALQRIHINGVDVGYRRDGSGEPLVFLHGMGLTNNWLNCHVSLAEHFDVIAPQHPGYASTKRPAWYRTLDDMVPHYADLLDGLQIDKAHIVGHSLGGLIGGAFAASYPERLLSLTLITPMPMPVITAPELLEPHDGPPPPNIGDILLNDNSAAYPEYLDDLLDFGDNTAAADDEFSDPGEFKLDVSPGLYRRLARVQAPAQVLIPDEDRGFPESAFRDWAKWLGAPVVTISGAEYPTGHLLIVQEPDAIAKQIVKLS